LVDILNGYENFDYLSRTLNGKLQGADWTVGAYLISAGASGRRAFRCRNRTFGRQLQRRVRRGGGILPG
jgi:hypothetical protein